MESSKSTEELENILKKGARRDLGEYLEQCSDELMTEKDFGAYVKSLIKSKGYNLRDVFTRADIRERYGYKLLSGEKKTRKRDVILRIAISAHMSLEEINRCLMLYGFSPLYVRIPRDAAISFCINEGRWDVNEVNEILEAHGFAILEECGECN